MVEYILGDFLVETGKLTNAQLEEIVEKGIEIPIIKKTFLDKDKILDIINDISLAIPEEIRNAKSVTADRERILAEAQRQADAKIKEAEHRALSLIDEHEITRKANEAAEEIIEKAKKESMEIRLASRKYADDLLARVERDISEVNNRIIASRNELK